MVVFDRLYGVNGKEDGFWVIPTSCPCCNKCWLRTDNKGNPLVYIDHFGNKRTECVWHGPYRGYIETDD